MNEFEYDNEFDADEFDYDNNNYSKKTTTKKQEKNTYVKKRDTDNLHDDNYDFDHMEDLEDIPTKDTKKQNKVDDLGIKPNNNKLPKLDDRKPKVEESKLPKIDQKPLYEEKKPLWEEKKPKVEERKPAYQLPGQVKGKEESLEEEEIETYNVKPTKPSRKKESPPKKDENKFDKLDDIDLETYLNSKLNQDDSTKDVKPKKEVSNPKFEEHEYFEEEMDDGLKDSKQEEKGNKSLIESKPFEIKKKPPSSQKDRDDVLKPGNLRVNNEEYIRQPGPDPSKGPNFEKLKDQNTKLRNELKALAKAADEALQRERQNRLAKRPKETEDAELREKMQELKDQLFKIDQLKHQIAIMKRQLENTYNLPKVIEKEDALRAAQKELNKVIDEKNSLMKIKQVQNKALDFLNNEGEYDKKLKQVTEELRKAKEEHRKQNEIFLENDKTMKRLHERIIIMEERCKELQKKIKEKKNEKPQSQDTEEISEASLHQLEQRLKELQEKKTSLDKNFDEEIKALEKKKKGLIHENTKLASYLKEKEKEIRLNNLRLKELRKLTKLGPMKPMTSGNENTGNTNRRNSLSDGRRSPSGEKGIEGVRSSGKQQSTKEENSKSIGEIDAPNQDKKLTKKPTEESYAEEKFDEEFVEDKVDNIDSDRNKGNESPVENDEGNNEQKGVFSKPTFMKKKK